MELVGVISRHISQSEKLVDSFIKKELTREQMINAIDSLSSGSYSDGYNQCIEDLLSREEEARLNNKNL